MIFLICIVLECTDIQYQPTRTETRAIPNRVSTHRVGRPPHRGLTVRLLVASTGTWTSELLRFATTRVGDQQGSVVLGQDVLELLAGRLIDVLLVERHQGLGDGLADGVDLGDMTTTGNPDADVDAGELFLAEQQQRLLQFVLEDLGFDLVQRASVHAEQAPAALAVRNGGRGFLETRRNWRVSTFMPSPQLDA